MSRTVINDVADLFKVEAECAKKGFDALDWKQNLIYFCKQLISNLTILSCIKNIVIGCFSVKKVVYVENRTFTISCLS